LRLSSPGWIVAIPASRMRRSCAFVRLTFVSYPQPHNRFGLLMEDTAPTRAGDQPERHRGAASSTDHQLATMVVPLRLFGSVGPHRRTRRAAGACPVTTSALTTGVVLDRELVGTLDLVERERGRRTGRGQPRPLPGNTDLQVEAVARVDPTATRPR